MKNNVNLKDRESHITDRDIYIRLHQIQRIINRSNHYKGRTTAKVFKIDERQLSFY